MEADATIETGCTTCGEHADYTVPCSRCGDDLLECKACVEQESRFCDYCQHVLDKIEADV